MSKVISDIMGQPPLAHATVDKIKQHILPDAFFGTLPVFQKDDEILPELMMFGTLVQRREGEFTATIIEYEGKSYLMDISKKGESVGQADSPIRR